MYRIDQQSNRIRRMKEMTFSELGFLERNHLQEWVANEPDSLGEELLIIQKEFAGFDDTNERLDLLAIDKHGSLVVIENKLDDSGRDVVWQALKYASYCSTLSKNQIVQIYQKYLEREQVQATAQERICAFLDEPSFDDVILNAGKDQRIILVAAKFRKEVTSTVLWLLHHKVYVKCFKATPYRDDSSLFLTLDQVIPLPEAEELMISMAEKEEQESDDRKEPARYGRRVEFWQAVLERLQADGVTLFAGVAANKDSWLSTGSGLSGVKYVMSFNRDEVRVVFAFERASEEQNKQLFDSLFARSRELNERFGAELEWRRNDNKKSAAIVFARDFDSYDRGNWPEMAKWIAEHLKRLERTFGPEVRNLQALLR